MNNPPLTELLHSEHKVSHKVSCGARDLGIHANELCAGGYHQQAQKERFFLGSSSHCGPFKKVLFGNVIEKPAVCCETTTRSVFGKSCGLRRLPTKLYSTVQTSTSATVPLQSKCIYLKCVSRWNCTEKCGWNECVWHGKPRWVPLCHCRNEFIWDMSWNRIAMKCVFSNQFISKWIYLALQTSTSATVPLRSKWRPGCVCVCVCACVHARACACVCMRVRNSAPHAIQPTHNHLLHKHISERNNTAKKTQEID